MPPPVPITSPAEQIYALNPQTTRIFPPHVCLSPNPPPLQSLLPLPIPPAPKSCAKIFSTASPGWQHTGEASPHLPTGFGGLAASPQEPFLLKSPEWEQGSLSASPSQGSSWRVLWLPTGQHSPHSNPVHRDLCSVRPFTRAQRGEAQLNVFFHSQESQGALQLFPPSIPWHWFLGAFFKHFPALS